MVRGPFVLNKTRVLSGKVKGGMEVQRETSPSRETERSVGAKARGPDGEKGQLRPAEGGRQVV